MRVKPLPSCDFFTCSPGGLFSGYNSYKAAMVNDKMLNINYLGAC